jgi:hypothetical protein
LSSFIKKQLKYSETIFPAANHSFLTTFRGYQTNEIMGWPLFIETRLSTRTSVFEIDRNASRGNFGCVFYLAVVVESRISASAAHFQPNLEKNQIKPLVG